MLKKSFISSLYVIPATAVVILFATHLWTPYYLITPPKFIGFEQQIETAISVLCIAFYSFLLPNRFEIELCLVNGYSTIKLALTKVVPVFIYSVLTSFVAVTAYRYTPFDLIGYKSLIPIEVPENFKLYSFISVFVTILFFSSVYFFLRVLTRNCFLPVIADLMVFSILLPISEGIKKGTTDIRVSLVDPFITTYFVGNTVPNTFARKYNDLTILKNAWSVNRFFFLFISLVLLSSTLILLRRERLHRGIGE